jgi:hypothetical protein
MTRVSSEALGLSDVVGFRSIGEEGREELVAGNGPPPVLRSSNRNTATFV